MSMMRKTSSVLQDKTCSTLFIKQSNQFDLRNNFIERTFLHSQSVVCFEILSRITTAPATTTSWGIGDSRKTFRRSKLRIAIHSPVIASGLFQTFTMMSSNASGQIFQFGLLILPADLVRLRLGSENHKTNFHAARFCPFKRYCLASSTVSKLPKSFKYCLAPHLVAAVKPKIPL